MHLLITQQGQTQPMHLQNIVERAERTVLYFYPRDNTPGCTAEAIEFTIYADEFKRMKTQIIGVSKDSPGSHCSFIEKYQLKIDLISDSELTLHKIYGAWGEKNMYGKTSEGTIRSTIILNKDMEIIHTRRNVKAKGHAETVLARISTNLKA